LGSRVDGGQDLFSSAHHAIWKNRSSFYEINRPFSAWNGTYPFWVSLCREGGRIKALFRKVHGYRFTLRGGFRPARWRKVERASRAGVERLSRSLASAVTLESTPGASRGIASLPARPWRRTAIREGRGAESGLGFDIMRTTGYYMAVAGLSPDFDSDTIVLKWRP
jgi:hypothetical protein